MANASRSKKVADIDSADAPALEAYTPPRPHPDEIPAAEIVALDSADAPALEAYTPPPPPIPDETPAAELVALESGVTPARSPLMLDPGNASLTIGSKTFRVAKQVTRTVLRQVDNEPFAITITSPIYVGEELSSGRGGVPKMQPAKLCEVTNLETGELQVLIVNTVLKSELERAYKDDDYLNRSFIICRKDGPKLREDRQPYKVYSIAEIEADAPSAETSRIVSNVHG